MIGQNWYDIIFFLFIEGVGRWGGWQGKGAGVEGVIMKEIDNYN